MSCPGDCGTNSFFYTDPPVEKKYQHNPEISNGDPYHLLDPSRSRAGSVHSSNAYMTADSQRADSLPLEADSPGDTLPCENPYDPESSQDPALTALREATRHEEAMRAIHEVILNKH
jgi:hypothetical protein